MLRHVISISTITTAATIASTSISLSTAAKRKTTKLHLQAASGVYKIINSNFIQSHSLLSDIFSFLSMIFFTWYLGSWYDITQYFPSTNLVNNLCFFLNARFGDLHQLAKKHICYHFLGIWSFPVSDHFWGVNSDFLCHFI